MSKAWLGGTTRKKRGGGSVRISASFYEFAKGFTFQESPKQHEID